MRAFQSTSRTIELAPRRVTGRARLPTRRLVPPESNDANVPRLLPHGGYVSEAVSAQVGRTSHRRLMRIPRSGGLRVPSRRSQPAAVRAHLSCRSGGDRVAHARHNGLQRLQPRRAGAALCGACRCPSSHTRQTRRLVRRRTTHQDCHETCRLAGRMSTLEALGSHWSGGSSNRRIAPVITPMIEHVRGRITWWR